MRSPSRRVTEPSGPVAFVTRKSLPLSLPPFPASLTLARVPVALSYWPMLELPSMFGVDEGPGDQMVRRSQHLPHDPALVVDHQLRLGQVAGEPDG